MPPGVPSVPSDGVNDEPRSSDLSAPRRIPEATVLRLPIYQRILAELVRGAPSLGPRRRGYGFVEHGGGEDLFVHHSQVQGDARQGIAEGATVEFTIGSGRRGDEAQNVKVI